jgi:hypothetical protein
MDDWMKYANTLVSNTGSVTLYNDKIVVERTVKYSDSYTPDEYEALKKKFNEGFRKYMKTR